MLCDSGAAILKSFRNPKIQMSKSKLFSMLHKLSQDRLVSLFQAVLLDYTKVCGFFFLYIYTSHDGSYKPQQNWIIQNWFKSTQTHKLKWPWNCFVWRKKNGDFLETFLTTAANYSEKLLQTSTRRKVSGRRVHAEAKDFPFSPETCYLCNILPLIENVAAAYWRAASLNVCLQQILIL